MPAAVGHPAIRNGEGGVSPALRNRARREGYGVRNVTVMSA